MSEFAMVDELADLIKDNLHCKHLVLSMEEDFIVFLNNDTNPDGIMELQPMNSYNRLLLHRLADIFGFAHESVGEGDDRHLILKRCPETSIPSILVSDILGQYDDHYYPTTSHESTDDSAVEELAYKVKDDLQCKHLVLSMEKVFIDFIQDDTSSDGIMELQPMSTYNRHLLHLLTDIFGYFYKLRLQLNCLNCKFEFSAKMSEHDFSKVTYPKKKRLQLFSHFARFSHESVGEGDDRHLVLERCPESSIPSILVSDILRQNDGHRHPSTSHQLLKRTEDSPVSKTNTPAFQHSLEAREAAYLAARERIFSKDESETKGSAEQKPRNVPVVAQRMIAHALGQRIKPCNQEVTPRETKSNFQEETEVTSNFSVEACQETICQSSKNVNSLGEPNYSNPNRSALQCERKVMQKPADTDGGVSPNGRDGSVVSKDNLKEKHFGAAKRMFAHALGLPSAKDSLVSKSSEAKKMDRE